MATLTVLKFPTASGAEDMLGMLEGLQKQQLITIQDAAIVSWPVGKKKPKTRQLHNLAGFGALEGAFWGMLFGLLFFVPILGLAVGAGMGALAGSFADVGIDDKFIKEVRSKVTEGTSALFLMSSGAVADRITPSIQGTQAEIISTNLSKEEEDKLRAAFSSAD
jgi:uncharacterized membrane protein